MRRAGGAIEAVRVRITPTYNRRNPVEAGENRGGSLEAAGAEGYRAAANAEAGGIEEPAAGADDGFSIEAVSYAKSGCPVIAIRVGVAASEAAIVDKGESASEIIAGSFEGRGRLEVEIRQLVEAVGDGRLEVVA